MFLPCGATTSICRTRPSGAVCPIRFVFTNKITRHDKLLLAFDGLVISEVFGREVTLGKIVHGDDHVTLRVKVPALKNEVAKLTDRIDVLITAASPPDLVLNRHCAECEFKTRCSQKAVEKDDLSLLSSMTERERTDFNSKGIFTVTQLSFTFRPRRRPKGEIESGHRYVFQNRLKISGAWWKMENLRKMIALRVLRANGGWEDYWSNVHQQAA
jgi:predicted RecB family nuclease